MERLHGVTMRTFPSVRGRVEVDEVSKIISPDAGPYLVSTAAVAVENTHNFGGGTVQPFDQLEAVAGLCRDLGVGCHLDGARLWNAHVATGIPLEHYGGLFDTVTVSFSKGLGAPVGSVLVGSVGPDGQSAGLAEAVGRRLAAGRHTGGGGTLRA